MSTEYYVDIINYGEIKAITTLGPYRDERTAEKAERGANYGLHGSLYTLIRKEQS